MPGKRTIVSAARTLMYGGIGACFAFENPETKTMVEVALVGGLLADYFTWLLVSILMLPKYFWHGCYDTCVNVVFGWFLFQRADVVVDFHNASSLGVEAFAFLLVMAVKVIFYSLKILDAEMGDDL